MAAATLAAEHSREEQPLVDLEPALVALDQTLLGGELLLRWNEARHDIRGAGDQLPHPPETRALPAARVIAGVGVPTQKTQARFPRFVLNERRRGIFPRVAARLLRQSAQQARRALPIGRESRTVRGHS